MLLEGQLVLHLPSVIIMAEIMVNYVGPRELQRRTVYRPSCKNWHRKINPDLRTKYRMSGPQGWTVVGNVLAVGPKF